MYKVSQRRLDRDIVHAFSHGEKIPLKFYYESKQRINSANNARTKRIRRNQKQVKIMD